MTARRFVSALILAILALGLGLSTALLPCRAEARAPSYPGIEPPAPDSTGILTSIQVTGLRTLQPCAGESVRVVLSGMFPNDCYSIERIDVIYPRCFAPCAPQIVVVVNRGECLGRPCIESLVPWQRKVVYEPLPEGSYTQDVSIWSVACGDSAPPDSSKSFSQPFTVSPESECGTTPAPCLITDWRDNDPSTTCDATIGEGGTARVAMRVLTRVPLRALQGKLRLSNDSLRIQSITPIGPAAGMTLVWEPSPGGASFVMFAASGAPLPASVAGQRPADILSVGVAVRPGHRAPPVTYLLDQEMLGADETGNEVRPCPVLTLEFRGARICAPSAVCDVNGDGRINVRDLVRMLVCLQAGCPDSSRFDCDDNQRFDLGDVICCAHRMLRGPNVSEGPPRPAAGTRVEFGVARRIDGGWRLPLVLTGAENVGAARLALRYPSDRFEIGSLRQLPGAPNWLSLTEAEGGALSLGLLNLDSGRLDLVLPQRLELELDLNLREGQSAGGSIEIAAAEFAAQNGDALDVPLPATGLRIPSGLSLSAGRPNPFSSTTQLVLGLEHAADVRVTVHDLSGRRVATLLDGRFSAGQRDLSWNGRDDAGAETRDGIYFVRCAGGGEEISRKLIRLRGR